MYIRQETKIIAVKSLYFLQYFLRVAMMVFFHCFKERHVLANMCCVMCFKVANDIPISFKSIENGTNMNVLGLQ